jgi:DNA-binding transcriptional regulator YdaS (Cro superfamily)
MKITTAHRALRRAIEAAGGQSALASAIGVRQSYIWYWLHKSEYGVPAERVLEIEQATGVARHELRPDLFATADSKTTPELAKEGASFDDEAERRLSKERSKHFSRFKHLRRARFRTAEEIEEHIRALREEWTHR